MKRSTSSSTAASSTHPGAYRSSSRGLDAEDDYQLLRRLLSEAGLRACRVEPDPNGGAWTVFAIQPNEEGAWRTFSLSVEDARLRRAGADRQARRLLVAHLATSLAVRDASH